MPGRGQEKVGEPGVKPGLRQAEIRGLLVVEMSSGELAGAASRMNTTVMRREGGGFEVEFNQKVGEMMEGATQEVEKFIRMRYPEGKLPTGTRVELSFADRYSPKDGPSAAVVSALLVDSIVSGKEIDQGFAATGDMTATGQVRRVGGVASKLKGAARGGCTHVGIPSGNKASLADAYLLRGIKSLYEVQVFSLESFEEAAALAMKERPAKMEKALEEFAKVQKVLKRDPRNVHNDKVKAKLREVVKLAPNHLSARLLYLHGAGKGPKRLSLVGSIDGIEIAGAKLGEMMDDGSFQKAEGLKDDVLTGLINDFSRLRPKLDKRTLKYADSYMDVARFLKKNRDRRKFSQSLRNEFEGLLGGIRSERKRLANNPEVREELMTDE